jgi:hypothetical protein
MPQLNDTRGPFDTAISTDLPPEDMEVWGDFMVRVLECLNEVLVRHPDLVAQTEEKEGPADSEQIKKTDQPSFMDIADLLAQCLAGGGDIGVYPSHNKTNRCFTRHIVICNKRTLVRRALGISAIIARCLNRSPSTQTRGVVFVDVSPPASVGGEHFGRSREARDAIDVLKGLNVQSVLFLGQVQETRVVPRWA